MSGDRWEELSTWHNAWLAADARERERLRHQLAQERPDLVEAVERLIADGGTLEGFLETPALMVAATALATAYAAGRELPAPVRSGRSRTTWSIAGALVLTSIIGAVGWWLRPPSVSGGVDIPLVRFAVAMPSGVDLLSPPSVSPDGRRIAFVGGNASGSRLIVRELGVDTMSIVEGTDGATRPFWSPDSEWIGFSSQGRLMKVARSGGVPLVIDGAVGSWGGAWASSGVLVFQPAVRNAGLLRVHERGGRSEQASLLDDSAGDASHRFPVMLPDGVSFLYYLVSTDDERRGMHVARLDAPAARASKRLGTRDRPATYVPVPGEPGFLLWVADGCIEAWPLDSTRMRVGDPLVIDIAPAPATESSPAMLSATADVLAYAAEERDPSSPREIGIVIGWRKLLHRPSP